ncbi:MAG: hypothetical protein D6725_07705 [Planctomycetota bacterium]|nr:MAG: hypothetical protein D6725_07705 [Planctomycetota bacterium]
MTGRSAVRAERRRLTTTGTPTAHRIAASPLQRPRHASHDSELGSPMSADLCYTGTVVRRRTLRTVPPEGLRQGEPHYDRPEFAMGTP